MTRTVCAEDRRLRVALDPVTQWHGEALRWQRRYDSLRACSLLMVAGLAVLALVGWLGAKGLF